MEFLMKVFAAFNPKAEAFLFMWTILLVAVFCLAIVIERIIYLSRHSVSKPDALVASVLGYIQRNDMASATRLCDVEKGSALSQIIKAGLEQASFGAERIRNAIDEAMLKVIPNLEKRTGYLAVIGNVSTLIGLLGTVYGLIMSFAAVGRPGIDAAQKSELLAAGIATAMNSTFCGLSVAVTAIMIYAVVKAKTQRIIDVLDEHSLRIVNTLMERSFRTYKYHIGTAQLKEGVGLHITHNNIKIFTDNQMIKEINI